MLSWVVKEDLVGEKLEGLQREVHESRGDLGFYSTLCSYMVFNFKFFL